MNIPLAAGLMVLPLLHAFAGTPEIPRRNVVVICLDTLRADRVGGKDSQTPALDRFSQTAYAFEQAISASAWTLPSIMSVFTSRYPHEHRLTNEYETFLQNEKRRARLSPKIRTFSEIFKNAGYATAAFTGGAGVAGDFGFNRGFDVYVDDQRFATIADTGPPALRWIRKNKDRPFFLFLHGYDVHNRALNSGREEYESLRDKTIRGEEIAVSDREITRWKTRYDAAVRDADRRLGDVLKQIDAVEGFSENTAVAVFSDHGEELFDHGGVDHGMKLYDEIIRVPLILRLPGRPGRRIAEQVRLIDIAPTLLAWAQIYPDKETQTQMRGVSLLPLLAGEKLSLDAYSESDYLLHSFQRSLRTHRGLKFLYDPLNETRLLFDVKNDPREKKDLLKTNPEEAADLERRLLRRMTR